MSQVWLRLSLRDQISLLDALPPPLHSAAHVAQNVLDVYTCTCPQTLVMEGVTVTPILQTPSAHTFRPRFASVSCAASISVRSLAQSQSIGAELEGNSAPLGSRDRNVHVHFDRGPRATWRASNRHHLRTTMRGNGTPLIESRALTNEYACRYAEQSAAERFVSFASCIALGLVDGSHVLLLLILRALHICDLRCSFPLPRSAFAISAIGCAHSTDHPTSGGRADRDGSHNRCGLQRQLPFSVTPASAAYTSLRSAVDITYDSRTGGDSNQSARCTLDGHVHVRGECSRKMIRKLFRYRVHRYEAIAITSSFAFILDLRLCAGLEGVA